VIHALIYPCREASRLSNLRREQPLSLSQRVRLNVHLTLCGTCRAYQRQITIIETAFRLHAKRVEAALPISAELDAAATERIRQRLRQG
jgi:hypothetical protein